MHLTSQEAKIKRLETHIILKSFRVRKPKGLKTVEWKQVTYAPNYYNIDSMKDVNGDETTA